MCVTGALSRHADGVQALRSMSWPTARLSSATAAIRRRTVSMTTRCRCVERATAASGTVLTCAGATARVSSSRSPCLDMMSTCATRKVGGVCGCMLWCAHTGRLGSSLRQHQLTGGLRVVLCTLCVLVCRQWLLCTRYGEHASISTALTALQTSRFRATSLTMWSTATTHQDVCTTTSWTTAATPVSDVVMCMDVHHCCAGEPRGFDCRELDEVSCGETGGECEYRNWRRGCFPRSL